MQPFKIIISLVVYAICGLSSFAQPLDLPKIPLRVHFDPAEYDGGIQNWDFSQDSSGVLYVANNDGLLIFDGEEWKSITVPSATKLRSVMVDEDGSIYVGGQGQIGFFQNTAAGLKFESLLEKLPPEDRDISETWQIVRHNKDIYFSTLDKLLVLRRGIFSKISLEGEPYRMQKVGKRLFIQLKKLGIYEVKEDSLVFLNGTQKISTEIMGATKSVGGLYFVGINGSVIEVANERTSIVPVASLKGNIVNVVLQQDNGNIAVGTQNKGLLIFNEQFVLKDHYNNDQGISNRTVIALHEDDFYNLWVGLHTGIDYLELNSPFSIVTEQASFEGTGYAATVWNNKTFLGTNNGLFSTKEGNFKLIEGSEGQVYNLSTFDNESLILNHHKGAFEVKEDKIEQIHPAGSWRFYKTPVKGKYMAGSYDGIRFFSKTNDRWTVDYKIEGLDESSRVMEFENDSVIWMTHGYKGAFRITLNKNLTKTLEVNRYDESKGFPSKTLISVYRIMGYLVFTSESGLYRFDRQKDRFVPNEFLNELLGPGHVSKMVSDEAGNIYYEQDRKLGRLTTTSIGSYEKETDIFNRINKYLSDDLENISILDKENILIGGKEGFIHFNPLAQFDTKKSFNVVIREVKVVSADSTKFLQPYAFDQSKVSHGESVTINYASPYFYGFEELEYSYMLQPIQDKWSEWSKVSNREFNFLPEGEYTFQVKARNVYGEESQISNLRFIIMDPWYTSDIATLVYALFILSGFVAFSLRQNQKHYTEREAITKSKTEAIKEKEKTITEIQENSKQEMTVLRNDKLKTEINHKNNQLTSVTTHLLQKNELIQEIKKKIAHTIDRGPTKEELKKVLRSIEKNLSTDDSWDQFSIHFDQVHGDFLKRLSQDYPDMTPQETKLAAYLKMNLSSKEIAQLLNISVRGVEISRYRLRKRLGLAREINLVSFLMNA